VKKINKCFYCGSLSTYEIKIIKIYICERCGNRFLKGRLK